MQNMMFLSCLRFSMQLLISESVFTAGWKRRNGFFWRFAAGMVCYLFLARLIFLVCTSIPTENPCIIILYYAGLFACSLLLMNMVFEGTREELLFAGVCGYAVQHIAFAGITMILNLTGASFTGIRDFFFVRLLPYLLFSGMVYQFVIKKNAGKGELRQKDMRMVILALVTLFIVIFLSALVDHEWFRTNAAYLQNVFCKVYAMICSALAIFIAFSSSRQNRIQHENEMMELMLHNLSDQQKLSKETVNLINIKCHDLKYRLSRIANITDAEDQKEYIDSVKQTVAIYDNIFQTGNDALDLILTEKSLLCNEYNIKLSCMIDGGILSFMNSTDVYALFGNLMDNAIESVMKEPDEEKRIISLSVSEKSGGSYIHMENYCREIVVFQDGLPVTSKEDTAYHGFGVRSIRYLTEKYEGNLLMRTEKERFITDILFYPE